ncbi:unnamed protein product, partial [Porites evermanni]
SVCESSKLNPCGEKGICIPDYSRDSFRCKCATDYEGIPCEPIMKSCSQLAQNGFTSNGVNTNFPRGTINQKHYPDLGSEGSVWNFCTRFSDVVSLGHQWWRCEMVHGSPATGYTRLPCQILANLVSQIRSLICIYIFEILFITTKEIQSCRVVKADNYKKIIKLYLNFCLHSGTRFSTKDSDNDALKWTHCAQSKKGAWWYSGCSASNLNGLYHNGGYIQGDIGMKWKAFRGHFYSLKRTEMKVKPKS